MSNKQEELIEALKKCESTIVNCQKMEGKFKEGTPQYSLLRNRLAALKLSKSLIETKINDCKLTEEFSQDDYGKAHFQISSIIRKTTKAQSKYEIESSWYKRFEATIRPMKLILGLIEEIIEN